ncbi:hypothetical protein EMIHUDRAFT_255788 [Emiliania huxleyi CCMP1516]|uniref:Uncharacterized protein n=2 Tax=Emiliania huxleyi TaxID=2903 RepID=A0A0D3J608_EMIH1|nr:hypothetical protein EMIHUDRAFT_255788 [Emiliania huxleyi CCMP1516]EOD18943.1 hypothetical protein EMIHUDRAFT_255788 [Emiliania huxleyi CCMP1516]|eukprot:XP_005771372.1 hypothetical protein EMIHUDRAFT_255788 [Emiliania huxleyi CCMP1516]
MEPTNHLGHSYNKQPDVDAYNIGRGGKRYSGDVKVCPLTSSGEHGRKGAFVAFGNTESFYRNMGGGGWGGGDRRIPSYGGEYRYAREDKDVGVQLLLVRILPGGSGKYL